MSRKYSLTIAGHATSLTLDPPFWDALGDIALRERVSRPALIERIDADRGDGESLSAAVRVYVLAYYRRAQSAR